MAKNGIEIEWESAMSILLLVSMRVAAERGAYQFFRKSDSTRLAAPYTNGGTERFPHGWPRPHYHHHRLGIKPELRVLWPVIARVGAWCWWMVHIIIDRAY